MIWLEVSIPLIMGLQLNEYTSGVLGRVVGAGAGEGKDAGNGGIVLYDVDDLVSELGHGGERYILTRICLAENEPGVLLWKKAFRDRDVQVAGQHDKHQGRQERRQLMAEDEN